MSRLARPPLTVPNATLMDGRSGFWLASVGADACPAGLALADAAALGAAGLALADTGADVAELTGGADDAGAALPPHAANKLAVTAKPARRIGPRRFKQLTSRKIRADSLIPRLVLRQWPDPPTSRGPIPGTPARRRTGLRRACRSGRHHAG